LNKKKVKVILSLVFSSNIISTHWKNAFRAEFEQVLVEMPSEGQSTGPLVFTDR
jgi:hypothetical protein